MSYKKLATELHTIEEIALALENAHMKGYAEAEQNWWKQQDEEESRKRQKGSEVLQSAKEVINNNSTVIYNDEHKNEKLRDNDRKPILVNDKEPSKTIDDEMETKK